MTVESGTSCIHPLKDRDENVKKKRKKQKRCVTQEGVGQEYFMHVSVIVAFLISFYSKAKQCFDFTIFLTYFIIRVFFKKLMVSQKPPKIQRITVYSQRWQSLLKLIFFKVMQCDDILIHSLQLLDCSLWFTLPLCLWNTFLHLYFT